MYYQPRSRQGGNGFVISKKSGDTSPLGSANEEKAGNFQGPCLAAMKVSIQKMARLDFLQYWISKCLSCETNYSTTSRKFAPTGSQHQNVHLSSQI